MFLPCRFHSCLTREHSRAPSEGETGEGDNEEEEEEDEEKDEEEGRGELWRRQVLLPHISSKLRQQSSRIEQVLWSVPVERQPMDEGSGALDLKVDGATGRVGRATGTSIDASWGPSDPPSDLQTGAEESDVASPGAAGAAGAAPGEEKEERKRDEPEEASESVEEGEVHTGDGVECWIEERILDGRGTPQLRMAVRVCAATHTERWLWDVHSKIGAATVDL
eukprot:GHVU01179375.1.p1 GENE.GHVU01179375.1~~GHVU01179375.1.p1  ORF type:complete len:222 (+),score=49.10 GHVU01179375.1:174-839(+)